MGQGAGNNPSPRLSANFVNKLFFWWLKPIFYQGSTRDLKNDDLYDTRPVDISEQLGSRLEKYWKNEIENARQNDRKPRLINAIRKTFGWSYFYYATHMFILNCLRVIQPLMLGLLIQYFQRGSQTTKHQAYIFASSLMLLIFLHSLLKHHIDLSTLEIGMRLRIACSSLIYRKIVRLSNASVAEIQGGQVINLLTNDVVRFDPLFTYLHYIWITPLQSALIAYLIWRNVQLSSLVGILLMTFVTMPVQVYIGKITSRLREKIAVRTDERVQLMSEIINGIHVIKMYTWEKPFERLVSLARRYEINKITHMSYLKGTNIASTAYIDRTCLYFTLMTYVLIGNVVSADKVFSMVQYFTLLQNLLVYSYPRAIFNAAEARISVKRIEKFLKLEEIKIKAPILSVEDNASIKLKSVVASWTVNSIVNTLHEITMNIAPKKLHAIIGTIGSGKSSLLHLILGELRPSFGDVKINGTISYASQRFWIFPGTIRDNIIFDQPYDESRYREVVRVCLLERDFENLAHGDRTQVGDRGTNLSGGQCARINVARAIYRDADIYILDDPFSAVDATVCKNLFNDCINGYLKDKTRIFVTHQVQCLKETDTIFLLNNGKLEFQGKFSDFSKKQLEFLNVPIKEEINSMSNSNENKNIENNCECNILSKSFRNNEDLEKEPQETEELIAKGKMKTSILLRYFQTENSYVLFATTVVFFILAQIVRSSSDYWLAYWTYEEEFKLNDMKNSMTKLTFNSIKNSTNELSNLTSTVISTNKDLLFTTMETLLPNSKQNLLANTTTSILSNTSTNILSHTMENLLSNATTNFLSKSLLANVTQALLLSSTESLSSTTENILSKTTKYPVSSSTEFSLLNNSQTLLLNTTPISTKILSTNGTTKNSISNLLINDMLNPLYLDTSIALIIYGCILLGCIITVIIKCLLFYKICMNASTNIHNKMFSCVLRAPMKFFNKQTSGQILNRFSKDTGAMDEILPITMYESIEVLFIILGVIVQVIIINWWSILSMIISGFLYWKITNVYIITACKIKRLEGAAKSPVLSHVTASLDGLTTIRSSRSQTIVCRRFDARQDEHTRAHYISIAVASAFGLWLDLISNFFVGFVTFACLLTDESKIFAGSVGLAITQVLMLNGMLQRGIRQTAAAMTEMTSVERILQFTQLEQEESSKTSSNIGTKPPSGWPNRGKIEFKQFYLRYAEDKEPILRNMNFVIEPGAKVGIVGRTGAGKSSLISALFRFARADGCVLIDEIDTRNVSLRKLRKRIAIIPQEPVLFSASLRDNLDPFHEFKDTSLWAALEDVELHKAFVPLDHPIENGGKNLSAGQRQLLCLARAIVKKTKILVLDEATANVDPATDSLIRETIRNKFSDCTVLTVAHRLDSVIDNERIIVIDNGEIVEYDHPYVLLEKKDGYLIKLANEAGDEMFQYLKKISKETYIRLNNKASTLDLTDENSKTNGDVQNNDFIEDSENAIVKPEN